MSHAELPDIPVVVKVGGSLYDLPDLGPRLGQWLSELDTSNVVLVPGGGPAADVVHDLDRRHGLGEEAAHWLALHALILNAHFLARLLTAKKPVVTGEEAALPALWRQGKLPILDAYAFSQADDHQPERLPHRWEVTSDSVAARLAMVTQARRLILLKSVAIPPHLDWQEAGTQGFVDRHFGLLLQARGAKPPDLEVQALNFRKWKPARLTDPPRPEPDWSR